MYDQSQKIERKERAKEKNNAHKNWANINPSINHEVGSLSPLPYVHELKSKVTARDLTV